jgi:hypothetical protein
MSAYTHLSNSFSILSYDTVLSDSFGNSDFRAKKTHPAQLIFLLPVLNFRLFPFLFRVTNPKKRDSQGISVVFCLLMVSDFVSQKKTSSSPK